MHEDERILVGVVGAPHGVKGDVRLKSFTQEPLTVAAFAALWLRDGRRLTITAARALKDDMLVVRFADVADRDAAAALTNLQLFVSRRDLPGLDAEEFYHADLIGLAVETAAGMACGHVVALQNFGAGDVLEIAPRQGDTFYIPFTRVFVPVIDIPSGRVVVDDGAMPDNSPAQGAER